MGAPIKLIIKGLRKLAKPKILHTSLYKPYKKPMLGLGYERDKNILALIGLGGATGIAGASIAGYLNRPEGKPWGQRLAAINRKKKKKRDARREEASRASRQGVERTRYRYEQDKKKYGYGSK